MVFLHGLNRPWFKNIAVGLHLTKGKDSHIIGQITLIDSYIIGQRMDEKLCLLSIQFFPILLKVYIVRMYSHIFLYLGICSWGIRNWKREKESIHYTESTTTSLWVNYLSPCPSIVHIHIEIELHNIQKLNSFIHLFIQQASLNAYDVQCSGHSSKLKFLDLILVRMIDNK